MKTVLLKAALPFATAFVASVGAFSTDQEIKASLVPEQGFRRVAPFVCIPIKVCNNMDGAVCTDGVDIMYGKITPSGDCNKILTHRP